MTLILASASPVRLNLLRSAGIEVQPVPAHIDEESLRRSFLAESILPRDQADHLAELKAAKISGRFPGATVLGCDQVLDLGGTVFAKARNIDELRKQLKSLRGKTHSLLSAVVAYEQGRPIWRHVGHARLSMREFSDDYLESYLFRQGTQVLSCVGGYQLESEGVRLFDKIEGDYFTVLGLPLIPLLTWLGQKGLIPV